MTNPKVSIIVPAYNAEAYIDQCVTSILEQTLKEIEVVLVDDGSTDGTLELMKRFAKDNSNVRLVSKKNEGVTSARIAGVQNASGDYIGWVDADDFVHPEMFETLFMLCRDEGADLAYCDYEFYPHEVFQKQKWFREYRGSIDWRFIDRNTQHWNKLISRELLDETDIVSCMKSFGEFAYIPVMLSAHCIRYTTRKLYYYRVGIQSLSGGSQSGKVQRFREGVELSRKLKQYVNESEQSNALDQYFEYRLAYSLIQLAFVAAANRDKAAYRYAQHELNSINYTHNPLIKDVLDAGQGKLKSVFLRRVVPSNYLVASFACQAANYVVDYGRRTSLATGESR